MHILLEGLQIKRLAHEIVHHEIIVFEGIG
jgi:hypothetical protein